MKIVISATGRDKESNIDATFGRAHFFLIVDTKTKKVKVIENKVRDRPNGVGITAVNTVESEGVDAVITADIGPLAFETFKQGGVKIYKAKGKINDAIRLFEEGKLSEIKKATKPKYAGLKQKKVF
jgi:predicted Fe-Mo cluster-binding NifX family protein